MSIQDFCKKHNLTESQFNGTEKIGGSLDLRGLTSIPEGFNPTVGGDLDLRGGYSDKKTAPKSDIVFFQGGAYLKADGIFAKVMQAKKGVYRLCKLNSEKEFFMVTDGKFTHSHGETLKEAKESKANRLRLKPLLKSNTTGSLRGLVSLALKTGLKQTFLKKYEKA